MLRYVRGQFDPSSKVTVGAAFMSHSVHLPDGTTVKFEIWYNSLLHGATLQCTTTLKLQHWSLTHPDCTAAGTQLDRSAMRRLLLCTTGEALSAAGVHA